MPAHVAAKRSEVPLRGASRPHASASKRPSMASSGPTTPAAARHFKRNHDTPFLGLTRAALRRMAYRAGCKRLDNKVYDLLRRVVEVYVTGILSETIIETNHARRRTLTRADLGHTLRRHGEKKSYGTE